MLVYLSRQKGAVVAEVGCWEGENWKWNWEWRREFRAWENVYSMFLDILNRLEPCKELGDGWIWARSSKGSYVVKEVQEFLHRRAAQSPENGSLAFGRVWDSFAPLQVHFWRVLRQRLPTRWNLAIRQCLPDNKSFELWGEYLKWLGMSAPLPNDPELSLLCFCSFARGKFGRSIVIAIWSCLVWSIWKVRKEITFNSNWQLSRLMNDIIAKVWWWVSHKYKKNHVNFHLLETES